MPQGSDWSSVSDHIISEVERRRPKRRIVWPIWLLLLLLISAVAYGVYVSTGDRDPLQETASQADKQSDSRTISTGEKADYQSVSTQAAPSRTSNDPRPSDNQAAPMTDIDGESAAEESALSRDGKLDLSSQQQNATSTTQDFSSADRTITKNSRREGRQTTTASTMKQPSSGQADAAPVSTSADRISPPENAVIRSHEERAHTSKTTSAGIDPALTETSSRGREARIINQDLSSLPGLQLFLDVPHPVLQIDQSRYAADIEIEPLTSIQGSPWSLALSGGVNAYRSHFSSTAAEPSGLEVFTDRRITLPSPSFQLGLRYEISDRIFVETGAMLSQIRQRVMYSSRLVETIDLPDHLIAIETNQFTGMTRGIRADTSGLRTTTRVLDVSSRQTIMDIPLRLGYQFSLDKWRVGLSSGVSARWSLTQEGSMLTSAALKQAQSDLVAPGIQWIWNSQASLGYTLRPGLALEATAGYLKNVSSADRVGADGVQNRASLLHAQVGLRYRL